jgi:hypothetical protein
VRLDVPGLTNIKSPNVGNAPTLAAILKTHFYMSTTKKGNAFENLVYNHLKTELANDDLFIPSKTSQIFLKKSYFSKDRQSNIITDISIETSIPKATDYSLLTVVECKDYAHPIPVDDIEEFHSKIQQISGDNVKAIFATTAALQKSALAYAKSKRIAVIRFLPANQVNFVLYHLTPDMLHKQSSLNASEFMSAFLNQGHVGENTDFYACDDKFIYGSLSSLLTNFLNDR